MAQTGGMDDKETIVANVRNHFHTDRKASRAQVAELEKSIEKMLALSSTTQKKNVAVPTVMHYRNCYRTMMAPSHKTPIADVKCNEMLADVDTLLSSEKRDSKSTSMKRTCNTIMKRLKFMTANDSTYNLKTLMDTYQTQYRDIFSTCSSEVAKTFDAVNTVNATISRNSSVLRENMSTLTKKVDILRKISHELEEKTAQLASSRTQASLQQHDRVRIGPASLPLGHVPTRTYIIGMLVLIVALLVAIVIFIILLRNRDDDAAPPLSPSAEATTTTPPPDRTDTEDTGMEDSDMIDSEAVR